MRAATGQAPIIQPTPSFPICSVACPCGRQESGHKQSAMAHLADHARERGERNHRRPLCGHPRRPHRAGGHGRQRLSCLCRHLGDSPGCELRATPGQHTIQTTLAGLAARLPARSPPPQECSTPRHTCVALAAALAKPAGSGLGRRVVEHRP